MKLTEIYSLIFDLAKKLEQNNSVFTRADLAYELKELGVDQDSLLVSQLVWQAYKYYQNDTTICNSFINNDDNCSIVEKYRTSGLMMQGNNLEAFNGISTRLKSSLNILNDLSSQLAVSKTLASTCGTETDNKSSLKDLVNNISKESFTNITDRVIGVKGIKDTKSEADVLLLDYTLLIETYDQTKSDISRLIEDFIVLRSEVKKIYLEYSSKLVDVFGDSIKVIAPELFDFDSIEWLDTSSMLKRLKLEYTTLSDSCSLLLGEIKEDFNKSIKESANSYRNFKDNKRIGLALVGLKMINHYLDSQNKTVLIKQELAKLKGLLNRDVTQIKGDYSRLLVIYKTINEIYIPKAHAFFRNSETVLKKQMDIMIQRVYDDEEAKILSKEREVIIHNIQNEEALILDARMNIDYYKSYIGECKQVLETYKDNYHEAKSSKPKKPFFLFNWLTLNYLHKNFSRSTYHWNQVYGKTIITYEKVTQDVDLNKTELCSLEATLKNSINQLRKHNTDLLTVNSKIKQCVALNDSVRKSVLTELKPILTTLRIAKDILNAKLDPRLIQTVKLEKVENNKLPEEMTTLLDKFVSQLSSELSLDTAEAADLTNPSLNEDLASDTKTIDDADIEELTASYNKVVSNSCELIKNWAYLERMHKQNQIEKDIYDSQLSTIQSAFNQDMANLDQESEVLSAVIQAINTSTSYESLRDGLLELTKNEKMLNSDKELLKLLKGELTIEI